ncbi:MMPL family transporter [Bacillus testis]|uniref:MMPL family transporter n=1 Tax=Bacillus testis TaxID=1622072 RepID=UPI00067EEFDE|nr:MMPL family transporter [Bacillus testis]
MFKWMATATRSKKGISIIISVWILAVIILSVTAPKAKDEISKGNSSGLPQSALSEKAQKEMDRYFKEDDGTPAIAVFTSAEKLTKEQLQQIADASKNISENHSKNVKEVLPLYQLPPQAQAALLSEDGTSLTLPITLKSGLESKKITSVLDQLKKDIKQSVSDPIKIKMTGPAAIASDSVQLFSNADVVLILATVAIILVLLILIYHSPLLAVIPLLACGIVYLVVERVLGLMGKAGVHLDQQSLSIMSILLFAALTDYSLFVFARFREELKTQENKYESMYQAMKAVSEPIFFSGSTVFVAMLMLFFASDAGYRNFAPIFSTAMIIILLGGLTLVPALFTLFGKKAFWPFIPKQDAKEKAKQPIWDKIGVFVSRRPKTIIAVLTLILVVFSLNTFNIKYSFNLLKSFPSDMESREGFEILEDKYSPGSLAPTTVLITSDEQLDAGKLTAIAQELEAQKGVESITPSSKTIAQNYQANASDNGKAVTLQMILKDNPYTLDAIDTMDRLNSDRTDMLKNSGTKGEYHLYFTGETAKQADLNKANNRDTIVVVVLVTLFIMVMLGLQTRSIIAPIYMMATILLSYFAALGLGMWIFDHFFGYDAMSFRIPLYTFVFLVALGVDYNIMLISRIKEELGSFSLKEAVHRGIGKTGGVISSAGLILAATFAVLTTQPIQELFMFGFMVAIGVLMDTFLVRSMLVPAIILLLGKWSFWPSKAKTEPKERNMSV